MLQGAVHNMLSFSLLVCRSVLVSDIHSSWVTHLLAGVGFLPQNRLLYLMQDMVDLGLIGRALEMLEGVELAVSRNVISVAW